MDIQIVAPKLEAFIDKTKGFQSGVNRLARDFIITSTATTKAAIKDKAPIGKSGALKASIYGRSAGLIGRVFTDSPYAGYVNDGTAAHIIMPRYKKVLWWQGARSPVAMVHHPGTAATHFWDKGVEDAMVELDMLAIPFMEEIAGLLDV